MKKPIDPREEARIARAIANANAYLRAAERPMPPHEDTTTHYISERRVSANTPPTRLVAPPRNHNKSGAL